MAKKQCISQKSNKNNVTTANVNEINSRKEFFRFISK